MSERLGCLSRLLPKRLLGAMEAESRQWKTTCPNGHELSIWDLGGIRYKAAGQPTRLVRCPECGARFLGQFQHTRAGKKAGSIDK